MAKNILNKKEKQEIVSDVKKAIEVARGNFKKHNKKKSKEITIISIVFAFIILMGVVYLYFANNPRTLFKHSLDSFWKNLDSININTKGSLKAVINSNVKIGNKELNKYSYKVDYLLEEKNSGFLWKTYDENNLLSEVTIYNDDKSYVYIPNLYDKYFSLDEEYLKYNYRDIKVIGESLNKAFLFGLGNHKILNTKDVFKINGKLINTYKTSLYLNKEDLSLVIDSMNNYLNEDIQNNYGIVFNDKEIKDILSDLKSNCQYLKINVYTKGLERSFVKLELIEHKNDKTDSFMFLKIDENKYYMVFDNKSDLKKSEYIISAKKDSDGFIYDIDTRKKQDNSIVLDMETKIKLIKMSNINIKNLDVNDILKYEDLSSEEKTKIEKNLLPIKTFINAFFEK